jgi:hypothetical protein
MTLPNFECTHAKATAPRKGAKAAQRAQRESALYKTNFELPRIGLMGRLMRPMGPIKKRKGMNSLCALCVFLCGFA